LDRSGSLEAFGNCMLLDGVTPCQSVRSILKEGHNCVRMNGLEEILRKSSVWMLGGSESKA
jgi:hypothetical protein